MDLYFLPVILQLQGLHNSTYNNECSMTKTRDERPDPTPSMAVIDPRLRLAAAVLVRAIEELRSPDIVIFTDALIWLLCGPAPLFFEALDYQKTYDDLLDWIVGGNHEKKPSLTPGRPAG